jgi:RecB family endonuclease NucS
MENLSETSSQLHVESPSAENGRDYAERALQNFLLENPEKLGIPNPQIVESEYQTEVGRIDLLVASGQSTLWVVELKAGIAGREAIGQITSYIGAVRRAHPDKAVLGLLVATDFDKGCLAAYDAIGDVELKKVRIEYVLENAAPMNIHKGHAPVAKTQKSQIVRSGSGWRIVRCLSCGDERQVSPGAEAYSCATCRAFNRI